MFTICTVQYMCLLLKCLKEETSSLERFKKNMYLKFRHYDFANTWSFYSKIKERHLNKIILVPTTRFDKKFLKWGFYHLFGAILDSKHKDYRGE